MAAPLLGKTFFVTGATDGIGAHTAQRLAAQGATVLVHGRNPGRVEQAVAAVERAGSGSGGAPPRGFVADLASLAQVRRLAEEVAASSPSVDVLINNAGVFEQQLRKSEDGFELTWAVNVAAPFLLTACLLEAVRERVVVVSSISAASSIDWGNLQQERGFSAHNAYSLSKLAEQLFTFELADRLRAAGSPVTCNCLDPGTVNTKMLSAGWGSIGIPVKEANYELKAATDPALAGTSGEYFVGGRIARPPSIARDKAEQQRLWRLLEEQTGAKWSV
ncbi:short chain dehydrogenase reductase family [Chlorella sorokiniana]|uniref:Short chain dehydrogenase reductase family n=1 Tax=Chlorella sorokiniana TaxID=3076 RepID=A0A2P6TE58_CHLSO|nr:short chain dehydrogenase reductase family [Chlorella sorokiniana]|eukprot:PRW20919.1 short chain dehydrogenase reductase family [Chlorella sorokiniana]